jgi:hypothetical protein
MQCLSLMEVSVFKIIYVLIFKYLNSFKNRNVFLNSADIDKFINVSTIKNQCQHCCNFFKLIRVNLKVKSELYTLQKY